MLGGKIIHGIWGTQHVENHHKIFDWKEILHQAIWEGSNLDVCLRFHGSLQTIHGLRSRSRWEYQFIMPCMAHDIRNRSHKIEARIPLNMGEVQKSKLTTTIQQRSKLSIGNLSVEKSGLLHINCSRPLIFRKFSWTFYMSPSLSFSQHPALPALRRFTIS